VREPAIADESGTYYLPPPVPDPVSKVALGVAVAAVGALALGTFARRDRR
jgi:hypothetical protein